MKRLTVMRWALVGAIATIGLNLPPAFGQRGSEAVQWQAASNGRVPAGALEGGFEGADIFYICRARYRGGLHPGKLAPRFGGCNIPFGGREITVRQYEVLLTTGTPPNRPGQPDRACRDLPVAIFELSDAIPQSIVNGVFLNDDERATVQTQATEIRNLALRCGCDPVAQAADDLRRRSAARLVNRSSVHDSLDRMKADASKCQN